MRLSSMSAFFVTILQFRLLIAMMAIAVVVLVETMPDLIHQNVVVVVRVYNVMSFVVLYHVVLTLVHVSTNRSLLPCHSLIHVLWRLSIVGVSQFVWVRD